jgi:hypothetical protein
MWPLWARPYPLRLVEGADRADFTQWDSVAIPPPPASQVVDMGQLETCEHAERFGVRASGKAAGPAASAAEWSSRVDDGCHERT